MENETQLNPVGSPVPVQFISGVAGSGKSYLIREAVRLNPTYGVLCSTTGISAINLGVITVHSLLGFFDSSSLEENYLQGRVQRRIRDLGFKEGIRNIIIDEVSMLPAEQLTLLYNAIAEVNERWMPAELKIGLILVADFAQLPPVKAKWAFESEHWHLFDANTLRLAKVWRQADQNFLNAINLVRAGRGVEGASGLYACNPEMFSLSTDDNWPGTTILPKNEMVDRYNQIRADRLPGRAVGERTVRWKQQKSEWTKNIPDFQMFKQGGFVMLLSNSYEQGRELRYANGDTGWLRGYDEKSKEWTVELIRKGKDGGVIEVEVGRLIRENTQQLKPEQGEEGKDYFRQERGVGGGSRRWVIGTVEYWPMRYAWAATIHKTQGLSLDKVQINLNDSFIGQPHMCYVGVSRCRTAEGLRLVGTQRLLGQRVKIDGRCKRWL